jgi:hypothetical protein
MKALGSDPQKWLKEHGWSIFKIIPINDEMIVDLVWCEKSDEKIMLMRYQDSEYEIFQSMEPLEDLDIRALLEA